MSDQEDLRATLGPRTGGWTQFCTRIDAETMDLEKACRQPMTHHIAVHADDEPGGVGFLGVCEEHYLLDWRESRRGPDFIDVHDAGLFCGLPGALYWWSWERPPGGCELSALLTVEESGRVALEVTPC